MFTRDQIQADVLIIGAGPAGLATAIHLADVIAKYNQGIEHGRTAGPKLAVSILVIEKGSSVGSHSLSGATMDLRGLKALLPDIPLADIPLEGPVQKDEIYFLFPRHALRLPFVPPFMGNRGKYFISLGKLTRWLAEIAEGKGVQIFSGISGQELIFEEGKVVGVRTGDSGIDEHGVKQPNYQPGAEIRAKLVIFAEGARGHLTKIFIEKFRLDKESNPQVYSSGVKELWEVPEGAFEPGRAVLAMGWPLTFSQFGGGFIYGMNKTQICVGLAVGLDYDDPTLDVHHAFQIFKQHPLVAGILKNGRMVRYGAKAIPEGGIFSLPRLYADQAMIVGDSAGFVAMPALKGIHLGI